MKSNARKSARFISLEKWLHASAGGTADASPYSNGFEGNSKTTKGIFCRGDLLKTGVFRPELWRNYEAMLIVAKQRHT